MDYVWAVNGNESIFCPADPPSPVHSAIGDFPVFQKMTIVNSSKNQGE
jgi:hypothetical protein